MNTDWRKESNAPKTGTALCQFDEIQAGEVREFCFGDCEPFRMFLYRVGEQVYGYVNQCPHHWIPMNKSDDEFTMWDRNQHQMMCVHHCAVFELSAGGRCVDGPCKGSNLTVVPLHVSGGLIHIGGDND
ncbi:MAG: Rieske 2Fe-2S domain-containing protein [gamma proteobacterium symbiont of Ctena orbiculata]